METANWLGLTFEVCLPNANWRAVGGLYIFARRLATRWHPLYIGQTENFRNRLTNHQNLWAAKRLGMTHIHVCRLDNVGDRVVQEAQLIRILNPPLNKKFMA